MTSLQWHRWYGPQWENPSSPVQCQPHFALFQGPPGLFGCWTITCHYCKKLCKRKMWKQHLPVVVFPARTQQLLQHMDGTARTASQTLDGCKTQQKAEHQWQGLRPAWLQLLETTPTSQFPYLIHTAIYFNAEQISFIHETCLHLPCWKSSASFKLVRTATTGCQHNRCGLWGLQDVPGQWSAPSYHSCKDAQKPRSPAKTQWPHRSPQQEPELTGKDLRNTSAISSRSSSD